MPVWRAQPGAGSGSSSVRRSWEGGRKEGLQPRKNCGFESFPPGFLFAVSRDAYLGRH